MEILITERQYNILFKPEIKIEVLEGVEAEDYLNLLKEDIEPYDKKLSFDKNKIIDINKECQRIENDKSLPKEAKDDAVLKLVGDPNLPKTLQSWVNENVYDREINGIKVLTVDKRRFVFEITKHWAARIYRICDKPIEPKYKGIILVKDNINKIKDFIVSKEIKELETRSAIVLKMTEGNLYNEVIAIRKENNPKLKDLFNITFITQMENEYLFNKYRFPRIYVQ